MKLLILAGLVAVAVTVGDSAVADNADDCPIEKAIARIAKIDLDSNTVKLFRKKSNQALGAHVGQCLLIGDRVEAGSAIITIETAQGRQRIGRYQDSTTYTAPEIMVNTVPRGPLATVQAAFDRLTADIGRRTAGIGRGDAGSCGSAQNASGKTLSPLRSLPTGEQKIGKDLESILIAWDPSLGTQDVMLRFTHSDGKIIAERHVCGGGQYQFEIDSAYRKSGARLSITASTKTGAPLTWLVSIVDPSLLPRPAEFVEPSWLLGAWRLENAGKDVRMDALSRLASGSKDFLAASMLLSFALTNQE